MKGIYYRSVEYRYMAPKEVLSGGEKLDVSFWKFLKVGAVAMPELGRVSAIATNTLRFYRDPAGNTSCDLVELAETVVNLFRGRIASSNVIVESILPSGALVHGPQGELRQVIADLVGNALDAMPKGGRLIMRIRRFKNHRTGKLCVRLTIADTGVGMDSEVLSRVFEAFYTTMGVSGNGLGLWLSLEIMKKCGSSMQVRNAVGRGTVFHLSLEGVEPNLPA